MRTLSKGLAILAALPLLFATAGPTAASAGYNYHGVYDGQTARAGCTADPQVVTGNWSVRIAGEKVVASTNLFYDYSHHLAWGGTGFTLDSDPALLPEEFTISTSLGDIEGSPTTLTMTFDHGNLIYVVAPYNMFGYHCTSLTLTGHTN